MRARKGRPPSILVTAEHGGKRVPARYRRLFAGCDALLASHRGSDPGSLVMAREFAARLGAPLVRTTVTRLLVELNRSPGHPRLFSSVTRRLPESERERILDRYYRPYRAEVQRRVAAGVARCGRVVHVSSHSFTPRLRGEVRNADVGLLYDPARAAERALAMRWRRALRALDPTLRVRMNYPYAGRADGLTTHLRRCFAGNRYAGIELEVNQRFVRAGGRGWTRLRRTVMDAFESALR